MYSATAPTPPPAATSLWGPDVTPTVIDSGDANAVELGVQFSSATAGFIDGVRFYKSAANTGTHIGSLWAADGTLLAQATFTGETGSGWQQVTFSTPVAITAGTTYVAGYHTDTGHYSFDAGYFSNNSYLDPPLSAPGGNPAQPNGLFSYSSTPTFPTGTFNGSNYWVDVVYAPAPVPVSLTVTAPQTQLPRGVTTQLSATETWSDGSTKNVSGSVSWSSSNSSVASVSPSGLLSATSHGPATITAGIDGLTGSIGVNVLAPIAFLLINPPLAVAAAGQSRQLGVVAWLADGSLVSVSGLATWSAAPGASITISPSGVLSAVRPGLALLSATVGRSATYGLVLVTR